LEISQVETFLAVATFGGFHRAAEALRVSQPAVSSRIKALEESLGVMLFVRSRNTLTLSTAGRVLRPYAEQLLKTASVARQAVHELQPGSDTPLQIAAGLSISVYFLPDVLKRFQQAFPRLNISIRPGHSKEVLEMVLNEEAEIGLARSLVERGLGVSFLPLMAVGPEMRKAELTPIKLIDAEPLHRSLDLIHPRHRPLRAQAQSFLRVVREVVKERSSTSKNGRAVPKK